MDSEIVGVVTEWETAPFGGGYSGLHDLADSEFSGAVTAGSTWGFMLNGKLIGIPDGTLTAFEASEGTAYEAPDPALPLLFTMQAAGSEKQTEYYTQDTPLSEADRTLSDGNFTGYIELSENVHSGDYYTVYYGGKSMNVAFVGNSRELLTEDEAFDRACDEIGIYGVFAADIDVIDIPEVADAGDESDAEEAATDSTSDSAETDSNEPTTSDSIESDAVEISPAEPDTAEESTEASTDSNTSATDSGTPATGGSAPIASAEDAASSEDKTNQTQKTTESRSQRARSNSSTSKTDSGGGTPNSSQRSGGSTAGVTQTSRSDDSSPFSEEAEWRNTTTIPSLDPSEDENGQGGHQRQRRQSSGEKRLSREQLTKRLKQAEEVMEKAEAKHNELIEQRDAAAAERDEAQQRVETLETKLAEAEAEIEKLEAKLADAEAKAEGAPTAGSEEPVASGHTLEPAAALSGTNLFVRYDSKGEATLETAHAGKAKQEDVNENLRIEHHTTFETEGLTVDGEPFEDFLADQIEVRFANWLVQDLLYEIQATGTQSGMHGIFDAIPKIDRIQLHGTVELGTDDDDDPIERAFDVIVRNKHGSPLFVANFDESKEPVGAQMVEDLIRAGSELRQREDDFGAAFAVTTSYFSPDALEATEDATGGGLLSRSRGKSFVTLSRKTGFHLCLVDRIDDGFDLREPEI